MVVCAEVAKSCSDDDVTMEAGEMGGRPLSSMEEREGMVGL